MEVKNLTSPNHYAQFYKTQDFLIEKLCKYVSVGLTHGAGVFIIATPQNNKNLLQNLEAQFNVNLLQESGQLLILDAHEVLAKLMQGLLPDAGAFEKHIGSIMQSMTKKYPLIRAYGEMVDILWQGSNLEGTLALEKLWNELGQQHSFTLMCGYSMDNFKREIDGKVFADVCQCHSHVYPGEFYLDGQEPDQHRRLIAELQQRTLALQNEKSKRADLEQEVLHMRAEIKRLSGQ